MTPIGNAIRQIKLKSQLQQLGYTTFEDFVGASQVARPELEAYLGQSIDEVMTSIPLRADAIADVDQATIDQGSYEIGVLIDEIPRIQVALAQEGPEPGGCTNLISQMPPIKSQGNRGTCVAFAATAAYEHYLLNITLSLAKGQSLSEQFLYWDCKRSDGHPTMSGTWLGVAFPALKRDGECLAPTWPYVSSSIVGNEGQGPPPSAAVVEALRYRIPNFVSTAPTSVTDIRSRLATNRCVAFSIPVFNSWYANSYVKLSGDIVMPIPGEVRIGGHAMCIVGCVLLDQPGLGGGRFIIRNSWGGAWGIHSPYGPGYGTIPFAYIAKYCTEAYSLS